MSIGEKIKELRMKKGWTQKELADKIDRKQNTISYIENGGGAEVDTVKALADILSVTSEYLMSDDIVNDINDNLINTKEFDFALNLIKSVLADKDIKNPEDLTKEKMDYIEAILKKAIENKSK